MTNNIHGYVHVSTVDQHEDRQIIAMRKKLLAEEG